ncbi:hypothetical protein FUAX_01780 [Fulvitalea axinellae]|uniref:Gliding motility-associated protein GldE n=1 Tax=Fulvitalea axinellae TaxID=1182444 RepID=A0AAU9C6S9_9BACT|nr:hypothetical protein FUAX_01780 [Fulvitalea axinellae]
MESALEDPYPSSILLNLMFEGGFAFYSLSIAFGLLLLSMSFLVSGSEVAYFSLTADQLDKCRQSSSPAERRVSDLLGKPKQLLATILILNNFINIAIVTLSTVLTWYITGSRNNEGLLVVALSGVVSFLILFFGEVIPKNYALHNSLAFAKAMSAPFAWARALFQPLAWALTSLSSLIERRVEKKGYNVSIDELNYALDITSKDTTEEEKEILKGIVNFGTLTVKQVMQTRLDITAIDSELDFHEVVKEIHVSNYSRIPVYNGSLDKIEGILYGKDLLPYLNKDQNFDWHRLLRPSYFIPESKKIDSLLKEFQHKRVHMAIVVDEYGGTSGLITLEDIIEEIVGEINDEFDVPDDVGYNRIDDNTFVFEAKTSLNDFCKVTDLDPSDLEEVKGESESVGGLILELNGTLPATGAQITYGDLVFTIVVADQKRIEKVRVKILPEKK